MLNWNYFYRYENKVALAIFLRIIFDDFSKFGVFDFLPIAIVLNIFMIDIAIFYTDTFAFPFVSASLYYFFQYIWEGRKNKNLIICGLLIEIGSCLKITVIFILIAIIIFLLTKDLYI